MSIEQLFLIAVFVAIAIFNFVRQARRQRRRDDDTAGGAPPGKAPREDDETAAAPPRVVLPPRVVITPPAPERPVAPRARPRAAEPRRSLVAPAARPRRARRLLRNRRDARRGIVLMTLLGPGRGLELVSTPGEPNPPAGSPR